MEANLTYYIWEGVLTGTANGRTFNISALSGGGGGSTQHRPDSAANNPYMEALKTKGKAGAKGHVHGGPIPPGKYTIRKPGRHPHLGLSAELLHPHWKPMGRDGFYIHGRGHHGSDGCIVPLDLHQFQELMSALTHSDGGTLIAAETMSGDRFA
jgi:hypothetical protein